MIYRSFRGILDGYNAIVSGPSGNSVKNIGNGHLGRVLDACTESAASGLMGVRRLRTEVGNDEPFLQRVGSTDDLAIDRPDGTIRKAAAQFLGLRDQPTKDLLFALRRIDGGTFGLLDQADLVNQISAFVEK